MSETEPIRLSKLDPNFKYEVFSNPDGKNLFYCFQCGTCTAACDVAELMDIKPHRLIRMAILGMRDRVLNSKAIWMCTMCFRCTERCPQNVDPTGAFFAMKNIAAREVGIPGGLKDFAEMIYKTGRSAEVGDFEEEDREMLGIPRTPGVNIEATRNIFDKTNMSELLKS